MQLRKVYDMGARAIHMGRRRVLRAVAFRDTPKRLLELAQFDHPLAARLARVVDRIRKRDASTAADWPRRIETERGRLLATRESLRAYTGSASVWDPDISVGRAARASRSPQDALALYLLVEEFKPRRVLELGTNVGISSAYMAAAQGSFGGELSTLELSPARLAVARRLHERLGLGGIDYVEGRFADTLDSVLDRPVDFAFIDGHHDFRATLDYFDRIWHASVEGAVFVFDDIRWSLGMEKAWRVLQDESRLTVVVDLCGMGIAVGTRDGRRAPRLVTGILA